MRRDVSEDEAERRTEMETSPWGFSVSNRPRVGGWSWGANPFLRRGIPVQQSSATSPLLLPLLLLLLLLHPPSALPHMLGSRFVPSPFLSLSSHPPHLPLTHTCAHTRTPVTFPCGGIICCRIHFMQHMGRNTSGLLSHAVYSSFIYLDPSSVCPVIPSSLIDHLSIVPAQPRCPFAPSSSPHLGCVTLIPRLPLYWLLLHC